MKIHVASDHAGFEMKKFLKEKLLDMGHEVIDHGAHNYNVTDDYPDFIRPCAEAVAKDYNTSMGIILGGSGQGEEMVANKVEGIRAAEYYGGNIEIVKLAREHNNANILSLGARFINNIEALEAVKVFINTPFSNEQRHIRRLEKIFKNLQLYLQYCQTFLAR
jgi:ribose 5-phosphate isomerase B